LSTLLSGQVVVVVGDGSPLHRAVAVTAAEAGADIALATARPDQEFAVASIANEVWAVGREQIVRAIDALDPVAVAAFAEEVDDRFRRVDALVVVPALSDLDAIGEVSKEAWEHALAQGLTIPFLAAQAFGRAMERAGGGQIIFVTPAPPFDVSAATGAAGLGGLASAIDAVMGTLGVSARALTPAPVASATAHAIVALIGSTSRESG
jgi:3-oxoacyl-[acyl-carrier protein] reductase